MPKTHRAIRLVFRSSVTELRPKGKPNTFQGNKSPCDSDCLFNKTNKKGQKKTIAHKLPDNNNNNNNNNDGGSEISRQYASN